MMAECLKTKNPECSEKGMSKIWIRIADITIALINDDPELRLGIEGKMGEFIVDEKDPEVSMRVAWGDLGEESIGEKIFDSGALWQLYNEDGFYCFRFTSPALGSIPYKVARVQRNFKKGEVLLHRPYFNPDKTIYPLEYPLDELLIVNFLALGRGAEVHACGVVDHHGDGHLFLGHSGAGKTTMARLWQKEKGVTILSDDRIVLRSVEERLWMYGTPWHGEARIACPVQAKLTGIYFLQHSKTNELVKLGTTEAVGRLFACSFPAFYSSEGLDFSLGFLQKIAKAVPSYELSFFPDKRVVEFIQGLRD